MNPIERALAKADKITVANKGLEAMSRPRVYSGAVASTSHLQPGSPINVRSGGGGRLNLTVSRTYDDPSIGAANSRTAVAHVRPGGYSVSLHNDSLGRHDVQHGHVDDTPPSAGLFNDKRR